MNNIIFKTNSQKVLRYLAQHPTQDVLASDIQQAVDISRSGVHASLQQLTEQGLIERESRGKAYVYRAKEELAVIKQYKVLGIVVKLQPLIEKLRGRVNKVILFGSCSRGENLEDSDIDLLITTHNKNKVTETLEKFDEPLLKPIIKTPLQFDDLKEKDPDLYREIDRGLTLLENNG